MKFVKLIDGPAGDDRRPISWPDAVPWPEYAWFGRTPDNNIMISLEEIESEIPLHRYHKVSASEIPPAPGFVPGAVYEYAPDGVQAEPEQVPPTT